MINKIVDLNKIDISEFEFIEMETIPEESCCDLNRQKNLVERVSSCASTTMANCLQLAKPVIKYVYDWFHEYGHLSKPHKYRVVLNDFLRKLHNELGDIDELQAAWKEKEESGSLLARKIVAFLKVISCYPDDEPKKQYEEFILVFRDLCEEIHRETKKEKEDQDPYLQKAQEFCDICALIRWSHIFIGDYMKDILYILL